MVMSNEFDSIYWGFKIFAKTTIKITALSWHPGHQFRYLMKFKFHQKLKEITIILMLEESVNSKKLNIPILSKKKKAAIQGE